MSVLSHPERNIVLAKKVLDLSRRAPKTNTKKSVVWPASPPNKRLAVESSQLTRLPVRVSFVEF